MKYEEMADPSRSAEDVEPTMILDSAQHGELNAPAVGERTIQVMSAERELKKLHPEKHLPSTRHKRKVPITRNRILANMVQNQRMYTKSNTPHQNLKKTMRKSNIISTRLTQ